MSTKLTWIFVIIFKIFVLNNKVNGQNSPCPKVFEYSYDGFTFHGIITLPALKGSNTVEVRLVITGNYDKKDKGSLEVADSQSVAINSFRNGGTVHYKVIFPEGLEKIPDIYFIELNGVKYCDNPDALSSSDNYAVVQIKLVVGLNGSSPPQQTTNLVPLVTNPITLPTQQTPIDDNLMINFPFQNPVESSSRPQTSVTQISSSSDRDWINSYEFSDKCGTHFTVVHTVINGKDLGPNEFPWLVALFDHNRKYFCSGSLISDKHVVTAAHCCVGQSWIFLEFGKHELSNRSELGVSIRVSQRIINHPEYIQNTGHGDIALIIISEKLIFSEKIKPICIWAFAMDDKDTKGEVAGWGNDISGTMTDTPMYADVEIVSTRECLDSNILYSTITSDKTFCAGGKNKGPCKGDSGAGFIMNKDNRWYLRGVISISLSSNPTAGVCDVNKFAVYSDVAQYLGWLKQYLL